MLSRFCGSSGYNYIHVMLIIFFEDFFFLKNSVICHAVDHQRNVFVSIVASPEQLVYNLITEAGFSRRACEAALLLVAVCVMMHSSATTKKMVLVL